MKLRALGLTNVRRFAGQTARIEGLGDGLSVIAAPNEYGKTTFFDALHALFFAAHGSRSREVVSLQPDPGGGAVEIAAEIDLPEGLFRIEKRFLGRPMARVTELATGRIIAQADEAEAWIAGLTGQGLKGPAGLLWVRQGGSGLDGRAADQLAARRDLLSTVAGEIDLVTGGRLMYRVMTACQQ
ncbi:MAG: AAA family ATPase [Rubellimicrobium sp.]|nr:AAA family ATPase [Rubellimicrobium sp.]